MSLFDSENGVFDRAYPLAEWFDSEQIDASLSVTLQAIVQGSASVAASVAIARKMQGTFLGTATLTDLMRVKRALAETVSGIATVGATLSVKRACANPISGQAAVTDAFKIKRTFIDSTLGQAAFVAATNVKRPLAATVAAKGTAVSAVSVRRPLLMPTISGLATWAASSLAIKRKLAVVALGQATIAVLPMAVSRALRSTVLGSAAAVLSDHVLRTLILPVSARVAIVAGFKISRTLNASFSPRASVAAAIARKATLQIVVVGDGSFLADMNAGGSSSVTFAVSISASGTWHGIENVRRSFLFATSGVGALSPGWGGLVRVLQWPVLAKATAQESVNVRRALRESVSAGASFVALLGRLLPSSVVAIVGRGTVSADAEVKRGFSFPVAGHVQFLISDPTVLREYLAAIGAEAILHVAEQAIRPILLPVTGSAHVGELMSVAREMVASVEGEAEIVFDLVKFRAISGLSTNPAILLQAGSNTILGPSTVKT